MLNDSSFAPVPAQSANDHHLFVVRIWWEPDSGVVSGGEWRGWVEHVESRKKSYFRHLGDLVKFIEGHQYVRI